VQFISRCTWRALERPARARATWESSLATHAAKLSRLRVDEISAADVADALRSVWSSSPSTATKVRGRIEHVLDFARAAGHRTDGPNPAVWRGQLSHLLPSISGQTQKHYPAIPVPEIPAFAAELAARDSTSAKALMAVLLTAVRSSDVLGMT
jgi:integrase